MSGMVWPANPSPLPGAPPIKAPADSHVKRSELKQEQQPPEKITDHAEEGKEIRADFVSDAAHIKAEADVVNADQMEPDNDVANAGQLEQEKDVANAGQMQPSSSRASSTGDCALDDLDHAGFNAAQTDGDELTETQPKPISVGVGGTDWALHGNKIVRFSDAESQLDAETRKNTALNSGQLLPNHVTTKGNESSQENARANPTQTLPNENLSRVDEIPHRDTRANANPPSTPPKQSLAAIQGTLPWNFTARERIGEIFCSAVRYLTLAWQWACQWSRGARDQLRAHCPWMFNNYAYSVFCSAIVWSLANPNFLLLIASVALMISDQMTWRQRGAHIGSTTDGNNLTSPTSSSSSSPSRIACIPPPRLTPAPHASHLEVYPTHLPICNFNSSSPTTAILVYARASLPSVCSDTLSDTTIQRLQTRLDAIPAQRGLTSSPSFQRELWYGAGNMVEGVFGNIMVGHGDRLRRTGDDPDTTILLRALELESKSALECADVLVGILDFASVARSDVARGGLEANVEV